MNIYHNGRLINGRFATFKSRFNLTVRTFIAITLILMCGVAIGDVMRIENTLVYASETATVDLTPQKIEELKDDVVSRLLKCESAGHSEEDGLVTFDPDKTGKRRNLPSFGMLQFKVPTVVQYVSQLRAEKLTDKEAVLLALDQSEAEKLAKEIIFEIDGGIWNWKNCADRLKLADEVTILKKLAK